MRKGILFVLLLFLLVGVVSASEDINETSGDVLKLSDNQTPSETPSVSADSVSGTAGKAITLKASVKNSTGPVSGVEVTFKLDGKTYTAKSDSKGVASVKVICPNSAVLKTTTKTKGKIMTKTTTYSKIYTASVSAGGASKEFKLTSKKASLVKKYKLIKKTKIVNIPVKNGKKVYVRGNYIIVTSKKTKNGVNVLNVAIAEKTSKAFIKFYIKEHYNQDGKWKWDKWFKIKKGKMFQSSYKNNIKINKVKVKYTQSSYKQI